MMTYEEVLSIQLWTIVRSWPVPMPVHANSTVLPLFTSTQCFMEVPCAMPMGQEPVLYNATAFPLNFTLCFTTKTKAHTPCIVLKNTTLTNWVDPVSFSKVGTRVLVETLKQVSAGKIESSRNIPNNDRALLNITTMLLRSNVTAPWTSQWPNRNTTYKKVLPWCPPDLSFPPVFTPCQSKESPDMEIASGFALSPPIKWAAINKTGIRTGKRNIWPFYQ